MSRYATSVDLRRALEARLKRQADESGTDLSRLRRIAVFDRISARLSVVESRWVLKGGTSLEFRLGGRARATKDLDMACHREGRVGMTQLVARAIRKDGYWIALFEDHPSAVFPDTPWPSSARK